MNFLSLFRKTKPNVVIAEWTPADQSDCYILPIVRGAFKAGKLGFDEIEIVREDNPISQKVKFYFKAVSNAKP